MPLFTTGKFQKPPWFVGVKQLPVDDKANRQAWPTGEMFLEYLLSFDRHMLRQNRKVLLITDNCASHKCPDGLKAMEVLFLPPNATSKLQPMDRGIIQNLKVIQDEKGPEAGGSHEHGGNS